MRQVKDMWKRQLPGRARLRFGVGAVAIAMLLAPPAEAGAHRPDAHLTLTCAAPFGGLGYVNESVDLVTGAQDVVLSCGGARDFTAVSDAPLTAEGELVDPDAPFDFHLLTRLGPTESSRSVRHEHRGVMPRDPQLDPVYQQTAATHVFSVPPSPNADVRPLVLRITEDRQGAATASNVDVFSIIDLMRVTPSSGLGDCDPACSFQDATGEFPLSLEGGASYLLDSNVSSSYADLGPASPEEPMFERSVTLEVRLGAP